MEPFSQSKFYDLKDQIESWAKTVYTNCVVYHEFTPSYCSIYIKATEEDKDSVLYCTVERFDMKFLENNFTYTDSFGDMIIRTNNFEEYIAKLREINSAFNQIFEQVLIDWGLRI